MGGQNREIFATCATAVVVSLALASIVLTQGASAPWAAKGTACLLALLWSTDYSEQENENSNEIIN